MPTFTQQELEEIRSNTERIERERKQKDSQLSEDDSEDSEDGTSKRKSKKSATAKKSFSKKTAGLKGNPSLGERLFGLSLLLLTILISYIIMVVN